MVIFIANTEEYVAPDPNGEEIPVGSIVLWYGDASALASEAPDYHLCDGTTVSGSTLPDMRGKFVMGAANGTELLSTGGAETHFHAGGTVSSEGSHGHSGDSGNSGFASASVGVNAGGTAAAVSHRHAMTVSFASGGGHGHSWVGTSSYSNSMPLHKLLYWVVKVA